MVYKLVISSGHVHIDVPTEIKTREENGMFTAYIEGMDIKTIEAPTEQEATIELLRSIFFFWNMKACSENFGVPALEQYRKTYDSISKIEIRLEIND